MIDDLKKYLEWRYGIKVCSTNYTLEDGYIISLILTDAQWNRVLSQKNMFQTYIFRAKSFMAYNMLLPFSSQREGEISIKSNLLILSGSNMFIDIMLSQLLEYKNQKAEEIFCIPLQNRITGSGDTLAIDYLNSLDPQDETIADLNIPTNSLDIIKQQLSQGEYTKRLLISLGVTFFRLKGYCNGFDKARINNEVLEYDIDAEDLAEYNMNDVNTRKLLYRTYMQTCQKFAADANRYMDELSWAENGLK